MVEDLYERMGKAEVEIGKLDVTVQRHEQKWINQLDKNDALTKLSTLMEMQIAYNKERDARQDKRDEQQNEQMKEITNTLQVMSENLSHLNTSQKQLNKNQETLGERVSDIENTLNSQKVDVVKLIKGILSYLATGIGSIAIAYIVWYFGWK